MHELTKHRDAAVNAIQGLESDSQVLMPDFMEFPGLTLIAFIEQISSWTPTALVRIWMTVIVLESQFWDLARILGAD